MTGPLCPTCNGPIYFVQEYGRWYCQKCGAYLEPAPQSPAAQQPPQPAFRQQLGSSQKEPSMVYVQGQQPYQQQQLQPGQGKVCKQCGTVNENWSITCKSCRSSIC